MSFKQLTPLDMSQLEILNARLQNLATAPSAPVAGQVWYDTATGAFMFRSGATNVDLRARANHTGTQLAATISDFSAAALAFRLDQFAAPTAPVNLNSQKITNLAVGTLASDAIAKSQLDAVVTSITGYRLDQFAAPTASVNFGGQKLTNLATPLAADQAVNKAYADAITTSITGYRLDQFAAPTGSVSLGSQKITNLATPTLATDASTKAYADAIATSIPTYRLDQFAAPNTSLNLNSQKIINLATPVAASDACTKAYVDAAIAGLDWKPNVRAASTANVALTGLQTIDGISLANGERVLLKNQTAASENGIWVVSSGAWARAADASAGTLTAETAVFVGEGTAQKNTQWQLSTPDPISVGSTALTFIQFGASTTYTGDGATVNIVGTVVSAIISGNNGLVRKFAQSIGDGATTALAVTHNLGTTDVTIGVFEVATGNEVGCDKTRTSGNVVTLGFAIAPAAASLRVVIHA